jgi:hypothetical protein
MDEDEAGGITTRQMDAVPLPVLKTPVTLLADMQVQIAMR